jgi:hypothetical protein
VTALENSWNRLKSLLLLATAFSLACHASAQLVATKDLTKSAPTIASTEETQPPSPPPGKQNADKCSDNYAIGTRDGAISKDVPEKVQLEIVNVDPNLVYDGTTIFVTVRLKNVGDQPIFVPWETPPVKPDTDPKTGTASWESVYLSLTMDTREDRHRSSILKAEANLAATPSDRAQHIPLLPGRWVDVKFRATVECYSSESWACQPLPSAGHAQLTARWSEELSTHQEDGCSVWAGHYKSQTAESPPSQIVYVTSSKSDESATPPR